MEYWEAVANKKHLMKKLNNNVFNPKEWETTIKKLKNSGFVAMAGDLEKRKEHYDNRYH